jgi:hypothetical protein
VVGVAGLLSQGGIPVSGALFVLGVVALFAVVRFQLWGAWEWEPDDEYRDDLAALRRIKEDSA